jgi:hypothetical protein
MNRLNRQSLQKLVEYESDAAITIYLPTHNSTSPQHTSEDQIRLRNLVSEALDLLKAEHSLELAKILEQNAMNLIEDIQFWSQRASSLLICASLDIFETYSLPADSEEYIALDNVFHLAPVMGLFSDDPEFYVLELAEHNPRLLFGDMYGLRKSEIELPLNFNDALSSEKHFMIDGAHGNGYPERFFKVIDKIIIDSSEKALPLILAGTTTETSAYKHISHYPNILSTSVTNSYDSSRINELYEKIKPIIDEKIIKPQHDSVINEYLRLEKSSPSLVLENEQKLIEAAEAGRVDKLLTNMSLQTSDTVQDYYKSNKAAAMVWQTKGLVLNLQPNEMPNHTMFVAKLRY